ncbi:hypothetical protein M6B38_197680 [Iris pallida]|uniref:Uncharacterized protein n=1 Tax=Iris pallida TaxID=29817 RepID=A0AAX6EBN7_IRIPA|nr:hypothetical protein M6B38_197680 [Iris pallida]
MNHRNPIPEHHPRAPSSALPSSPRPGRNPYGLAFVEAPRQLWAPSGVRWQPPARPLRASLFLLPWTASNSAAATYSGDCHRNHGGEPSGEQLPHPQFLSRTLSFSFYLVVQSL